MNIITELPSNQQTPFDSLKAHIFDITEPKASFSLTPLKDKKFPNRHTFQTKFSIPINARLDGITIKYKSKNNLLNTTQITLKKIIKGGDLPQHNIAPVDKIHIHNIPLGPIERIGKTATVSLQNPVFDILQPHEKIHYKLTIESDSNCFFDRFAENIKHVIPQYTLFELPSIPSGLEELYTGCHRRCPEIEKCSDSNTTTPIKHVVVVMLENISFDNIFATYPIAQNLPGENLFFPRPNTPIPDNLLTIDPFTGGNYLTTNRNVGQQGTGMVNPQRLAPNQVLISSAENGYSRMQTSVHNGFMDHFVLNQSDQPPLKYLFNTKSLDATYGRGVNIVMDYWDGNVFTGIWNYAQHYSMSDRCFSTSYGESIVGAINWGSGNISSVVPQFPDLLIDVKLLTAIVNRFSTSSEMPPIPPGTQFVTLEYLLDNVDHCAFYNWILPKSDLSLLGYLLFWFSTLTDEVRNSIEFPGVTGVVEFFQKFTSNYIDPKHQNIGDLLNKKDLTWGCFRGGWLPKQSLKDSNAFVLKYSSIFPPEIIAQLQTIIVDFDRLVLLTHASEDTIPPLGAGSFRIGFIIGPQPDFAGVQPFDYYASTSNPQILPYSSLENVGKTDQANHNYDIDDFYNALSIGVMPAVSYIRPPYYQSGHPIGSNAFDSQVGLIKLVNAIMNSPFWEDTVIFIQYDESNGNYDHVPPPLVKSSAWNVNPVLDPLDEIARRGAKAGIKKSQLRAGYGPRIPFLVISPWSKENFVSHDIVDQTSIIKFIENNWKLGRLGRGSYEQIAGKLDDLFDFNPKRTLAPKVLLDPYTGLITSIE